MQSPTQPPKNNRSPETKELKRLILWVGDLDPQDLLKPFASSAQNNFVTLTCTSDEQAFQIFSGYQSFVVVAAFSDAKKSLDFLNKVKLDAPLSTRVWASPQVDAGIREAINQGQMQKFLSISEDLTVARAILSDAVHNADAIQHRLQLRKESTRQIRELEALNTSLEQIVAERTQHIEQSKSEEEDKVNRVRGLIRFIKDLAPMSSFEEVLLLLRKEFRKFHKVGDPYLIYQLNPQRTHFLSMKAGQVTETETSVEFNFPRLLTANDKEISRKLANHFGRPFVRTLTIPLEVKLIQKSAYQSAKAMLCVEVNLSDAELLGFMESIVERLQPLSMTMDRLLLERELTNYSFRWEKTFDGIRDPIVIIDVDYEVLRSNKKFSDRVVQKKCYQSFANRETICEGCPVMSAIDSGQSRRGQIRVGEKLYEVHSYPISLSQGGKATNVVNRYIDVTQSRELYLRLLQSEKMGAIGLLAGNIAHELNNPLTGLRSMAQVLLTAVEKDTNTHSDLIEVEKAAGRSQIIIKNLQEFSTGTDNKKKVISFDEIVHKTMPLLKTVMRFHRVNMDLETAEQKVEVEPHLMQQVVFNLINNACQAMKDAGTLTIETIYDAPTKKVIFAVTDTGPGISEDLQKKIFEPFFTTKKEGLGTGLGLSLAKKIVESYGGEIKLESESGKGSKFSVILPEVS